MKLRIKGNSLRIRLTKTEVNTIATNGYLEEETLFVNNKLVYALQRVDEGNALTATMEQNKITLLNHCFTYVTVSLSLSKAGYTKKPHRFRQAQPDSFLN